MSVASTKAFYAQIAAGNLLALGIADAAGVLDADRAHQLLGALRELPDAMRDVVERRHDIAAVTQRHVLSKRSWALVGNGVNVIAARSCASSSRSSVTKRSRATSRKTRSTSTSRRSRSSSCARPASPDRTPTTSGRRSRSTAPTGRTDRDRQRRHALSRSTRDHHGPGGAPRARLRARNGCRAPVRLRGRARHRCLGSSAARARAAIEAAASGSPDELLDRLAPGLEEPARRFLDGLRANQYDGSLEASTATRLASILRYATGTLTLDSYEIEHGKVGTPSTVVEDLTAALTKGIEELTRPVDAIKHQAKTVTVGISRSDETLLQAPLVRAVLAAGAPRDGLSYRALRTLVDLDPTIEEVTGYTRYRIEGDLAHDTATLHVVDRGGVASVDPVAHRDRPAPRRNEAPRCRAARGDCRPRRT